MELNGIIEGLRHQREVIDSTITGLSAIAGFSTITITGNTHRAAKIPTQVVGDQQTYQPARTGMSEAARKRIALAQKKRWAKVRAENRKALKMAGKPLETLTDGTGGAPTAAAQRTKAARTRRAKARNMTAQAQKQQAMAAG